MKEEYDFTSGERGKYVVNKPIEWITDEFGCLNAHLEDSEGRDVHVFIQRRPEYCDRGHYSLNIDGALGLDDQDRFPRYFMSLENAKSEAIAFLNWRMWKIRGEENRIPK